MKKILLSSMGLGIALMSAPVPGIKDVIVLIALNYFKLDNPNTSPYFCCGLGFLVFIISLIAYLKYKDSIRIVNIVGFGNNEYWEQNNTNVETIDVRSWFHKKDKDKYLKQILKEVDGIINKYMSSGLSYTSIAPIPLVAIIGKHFSKIRIKDYYEYFNKSSNVKELNDSPLFPRLRLNILNEESNCEYALISVSTTAKIQEHQLSQFKGCLHYNFSISKPHQNSIYSKKQLFNYSNKIIEIINKISSIETIKRIYLVFATQSPLPFEVGKQLNDRISKEIVVCHYQNNSNIPYEWGIALNGNNKEKYISLKEENRCQ